MKGTSMDVEKETRRIKKALAGFRRQAMLARVRLTLFWLPERLGSRAAHEAANNQRDILGELRYAAEEYRGNLCRLKERGTPLALAEIQLQDDGYDGWLSAEDRFCQ